MKALALLCAILFATTLAVAAPAPDELTAAASLFNPDQGDTVWSANGEYLIGVGSNFLVGPAVSLFDLGETDGGLYGVAGKLRIGKTNGCWVGGRLGKSFGDSTDVFDYSLDARAGCDVGSQHAFATFYAQQTWTQGETGERTSPEGTSGIAGIGWRFGKK